MRLNKKGMDMSLLKIVVSLVVFMILFVGFFNMASSNWASFFGGVENFERFTNNLESAVERLEEENMAFFPLRLDRNVAYIGFNPESNVTAYRQRTLEGGNPGIIRDVTHLRSSGCTPQTTCICECGIPSDHVIDSSLSDETCISMECVGYADFEFRSDRVLGQKIEENVAFDVIDIEWENGFVFVNNDGHSDFAEICIYEVQDEDTPGLVIGLSAVLGECIANR